MKKIVLSVLVFCTVALAQPLTLPIALQSLGQSASVDWDNNTIIATGKSIVPADKTQAQTELLGAQGARADALRILAVAITALPITSSRTLQDCQGDQKLNIDALIRGATAVPNSIVISLQADGSRIVSSAMQAPIYGQNGLYQLAKQLIQSCQEATARVPIVAGSSSPPYTGLIVDARGLAYSPCVSVRILSLAGSTVWNSTLALQDTIEPPLEFSRDMQTALTKPRIGKSPMILQAIEARGILGCDVVLSNQDLDLMRQNRIELLLRQTKLVVVF